MKISRYFLVSVASLATLVEAFGPQALPRSQVPSQISPSPIALRQSMSTEDIPSDYESEDLRSGNDKKVKVDTDENDALIRDELKRELLLFASTTDRGAFATGEEKNIIVDLVTQLEALNPTPNPASACTGDWDLCFCSTQLFRSSPFFQSLRALAGEENKAVAENGFDLHERATSTGQIGRVRQQITDDGISSEVAINVGVLPGIPFRVKGTVMTRATIEVFNPETWEVKVVGTSVGGSNIPFLDQLLDDVDMELPVGSLYEQLLGQVPVSTLKTFYVDQAEI